MTRYDGETALPLQQAVVELQKLPADRKYPQEGGNREAHLQHQYLQLPHRPLVPVESSSHSSAIINLLLKPTLILYLTNNNIRI